MTRLNLTKHDKRSLRAPLVRASSAPVVAAIAALPSATDIATAIDTMARATPTDVTGEVEVTALPLPTGAATQATLADILTALGTTNTILAAIRDRLPAALDGGGGLKVHETP